MRPLLMLEDLTNLHDARYCAAVGIGMVTFDLDDHTATALSPAVVREMLDWVSGMEAVGVFGREPGLEIAAKALDAGVGRVMLPLGYDLEEAAQVGLMKMFDGGAAGLGEELLRQANAAVRRHPDALVVVPAAAAALPGLAWDRCVVRCTDLAAFHQLADGGGPQPFGYSVGALVRDMYGILDYDACDALTARYFQADFA